MQKFLLLFACILSQTFFGQETRWTSLPIDYSNIETRRDSFVMKEKGVVKGHWIWNVTNLREELVIEDFSKLNGVVQERFEMRYNKKKGIVTKVNLELESNDFKMAATISRTDNKMLKARYDLSGKISKTVSIDTLYNNNVILRPEVFGLISGLEKIEGINKNIKVYALSTRRVNTMNLKHSGKHVVKIGNKEYKTDRIDLMNSEALSNRIYLSESRPKKIIKVEVVNSDLIIQLVQG